MSDELPTPKPDVPTTERIKRATAEGVSEALRAQRAEVARTHAGADVRDAVAETDAAVGKSVRAAGEGLRAWLTRSGTGLAVGAAVGGGVSTGLAGADKAQFDAMTKQMSEVGVKLDTLSGKVEASAIVSARSDARTDARLAALETWQRVIEDWRNLDRRKRD